MLCGGLCFSRPQRSLDSEFNYQSSTWNLSTVLVNLPVYRLLVLSRLRNLDACWKDQRRSETHIDLFLFSLEIPWLTPTILVNKPHLDKLVPYRYT